MPNTMSIGQLAKKAEVSNRTLRYYEELGLIHPFSRGENRYRYYDDSHIERIGTIKMLQEAGFSLKEIVAALGPILDPNSHSDSRGQEVAKKIHDALTSQMEKLESRRNEIEQSISDLQNTMKHLQNCFGCKSSSKIENCAKCTHGPTEVTTIAQSMVASNHGESTNA